MHELFFLLFFSFSFVFLTRTWSKPGVDPQVIQIGSPDQKTSKPDAVLLPIQVNNLKCSDDGSSKSTKVVDSLKGIATCQAGRLFSIFLLVNLPLKNFLHWILFLFLFLDSFVDTQKQRRMLKLRMKLWWVKNFIFTQHHSMARQIVKSLVLSQKWR